MKAGEKQTGIVNQIHSQINQTQKQISQVYKIVQKRSNSKLQSNKKVSSNTRKRKKNKVTRMRQ
jgi:ferritin-like metal-binding protein YciE